MNIKSLLLGSAAALVAVSGARAADAVVVAEPEPVEYVRVCDVYGAGFYYMPGTETCLKISGYMRYDIGAGNTEINQGYGAYGISSIDKKDTVDDLLDGDTDGDGFLLDEDHDTQGTWYKRARLALRVDARSETELGTLRAYMQANFQVTTGSVADTLDLTGTFFENGGNFDQISSASTGVAIDHAYLELGGFRAGRTDSLFSSFTNYAILDLNDDIIPYGPYDVVQLAYTFNAGNGFTAAVALENPVGGDDQFYGNAFYTLDDYTPNVVAGIGYNGGWGDVLVVGAYDAVWENFAVKGRVDVNVTEALSFMLMGAWADKDEIVDPDTGEVLFDGSLQQPNFYGGWGGDWAIWGGATWKGFYSPQTTLRAQVGYDDFEDFVAQIEAAYELVPGFTITPGVAYTDNFSDTCPSVLSNFSGLCDADGNENDAGFGGFLRLQRNF